MMRKQEEERQAKTRPRKVLKISKHKSPMRTMPMVNATSKSVSWKYYTQADILNDNNTSLAAAAKPSDPEVMSTELFAHLKNEPKMTV